MNVLKYTLVSEGTTDANLIPIINWTLREAGGKPLAEGARAEFWRLRHPPESLADKLLKAHELFPCDVMFVHRDADNAPPENRHAEISQAVELAGKRRPGLPSVGVVPVRMLEAWLLWDELAIRNAAGNPHGKKPLGLPSVDRIETRPDPKEDLHTALRIASELSGRRLKKFDAPKAFWRVVGYMDDFKPLRRLSAFRKFEDSVRRMAEAGWQPGFYGTTHRDV